MANRRKNVDAKAPSTAKRKDRIAHVAGAPLTQSPEPPNSLSETARAEWVALMPEALAMRTMTTADLRGFESVCTALATEKLLIDRLTEDGHFSQGKNGLVPHPAIRLLSAVQTQLMRMLSEFGLTPRGRQSIDATPAPAQRNEFEGM